MPEPITSTVGGLVAAAAAVTALVILLRAAKVLWRFLSGIQAFLDDWSGEPSRPGHPEQPGVMARLAELEKGQAALEMTLVAVRGEFRTNGGSTLRDKVDRIAAKVEEVSQTSNQGGSSAPPITSRGRSSHGSAQSP